MQKRRWVLGVVDGRGCGRGRRARRSLPRAGAVCALDEARDGDAEDQHQAEEPADHAADDDGQLGLHSAGAAAGKGRESLGSAQTQGWRHGSGGWGHALVEDVADAWHAGCDGECGRGQHGPGWRARACVSGGTGSARAGTRLVREIWAWCASCLERGGAALGHWWAERGCWGMGCASCKGPGGTKGDLRSRGALGAEFGLIAGALGARSCHLHGADLE